MTISAVSLLFSLLQLSLCWAASMPPSNTGTQLNPQGCPEKWVRHHDLCYGVTPTAMTWVEAVQFCLQHDASLVTVEIGKRNGTVAASLEAFKAYLHSEVGGWKNESQLFWSDSEQMDKLEESDGCLAIRASTGSWLIKRCDRTYPALCEKDPVAPPQKSTHTAVNDSSHTAVNISAHTAVNVSAHTTDFTSEAEAEPEQSDERGIPGLKLHPFVFFIIAALPLVAVMVICGLVSNQLILRKMRRQADREFTYTVPIPALDVHGFSSRDLWSSTSLFEPPNQGSKLSQECKKDSVDTVNQKGMDFGDGLIESSLPCTENKKEAGDGTPLLRPSGPQKSPAQFVPSVASKVFGSSASLASANSHLFSQSKQPGSQ